MNAKQVPQIKPDGALVVCAWCYPGHSVFEEYPWLVNTGAALYGFEQGKPRPVSHGICQGHKEQWMKGKLLNNENI